MRTMNGRQPPLLSDNSLTGSSAADDVIAQLLDVPGNLAHQSRRDAGAS